MRVVSLFAGAGAADWGYEQGGLETVCAYELDKFAAKQYKLNMPHVDVRIEDINQIDPTTLPEVDGIVGSPPCQSWSSQGKGGGLEDSRGQLWFKTINIVRAVQPKFFCFENVVGMLSKRHRVAFDWIVQMLTTRGYSVSCAVLNANDFGVAQNRKRVFIVGYRRDLGLTFDFEQLERSQYKPTMRDAIGHLANSAVEVGQPTSIDYHHYHTTKASTKFRCDSALPNPDAPAPTLRASRPLIHWTYTDSHRRWCTVQELLLLQGFPTDYKLEYRGLRSAVRVIGNAVPVPVATALAKEIKTQLNQTI